MIGDDYNLQPDPFELVEAAKILVQEGFEVFPYCTEDYVLCSRLIDRLSYFNAFGGAYWLGSRIGESVCNPARYANGFLM